MTALYELTGRHFCVSFAAPADVQRVHQIGQSVLLDNGAFSAWKIGKPTNWPKYYAWADRWLDHPTTWAVIPDIITGSAEDQDRLLKEWPFGPQRGAPVWHMHEPIERLLRLVEKFSRVCIGSSSQFAVVLSDEWQRRMDEAWNALVGVFARIPWIHMLRGMACCGLRWPLASADSTDIARNHHRPQNAPRKMADRWDAIQCPAIWHPVPEQQDIFA